MENEEKRLKIIQIEKYNEGISYQKKRIIDAAWRFGAWAVLSITWYAMAIVNGINSKGVEAILANTIMGTIYTAEWAIPRFNRLIAEIGEKTSLQGEVKKLTDDLEKFETEEERRGNKK